LVAWHIAREQLNSANAGGIPTSNDPSASKIELLYVADGEEEYEQSWRLKKIVEAMNSNVFISEYFKLCYVVLVCSLVCFVQCFHPVYSIFYMLTIAVSTL
jgi:hypothetical protein